MNMQHTKIKTIKKVPFKGLVYNFSIDEDESYIANNIVVHNCIWIALSKDLKGLPKITGISSKIPSELNSAIATPVLTPGQTEAIAEVEERAEEATMKSKILEDKANKLEVASEGPTQKDLIVDKHYSDLDKEINNLFE